LDCKNETCEKFVENAPVLIDYLCEECKIHFKSVLETLDDINVTYDLNPKLVRGLDYYTRTTFEFVKIGDKKRQNALAGGGRYDDLISLFGGSKTPAIGAAFGVERIIDEIKRQEIAIPAGGGYEVMLACLGDAARKKCLNLINDLQKHNIKTVSALAKGSIRAQLRLANKLGANIVLIMGQREVFDGTIIMKDMVSRAQDVIDLKNLMPVLKKKLGKNK
jgi:histidyl-tRNA synthetase